LTPKRLGGKQKTSSVRIETGNGQTTEVEVIPMGSYDVSLVRNQAGRSKDEGKTVLVLVDANSAAEARRKEMVSDRGILLEQIFLMPNNQDAGELEDLLLKIIPECSRVFRECLDQYEGCLKKANARGGPNKKGRLYAYREAVGAEANDGRVDYSIPEHWNLGHDALRPLGEFLVNRIS